VETLYRAGLSNAVSAAVLALVVTCLGRLLRRRPAVLHCLWLLVLLKLVTPPLYEVAIPWPQRPSVDRTTEPVQEVVLLEHERVLSSRENANDAGDESLAGPSVPAADSRLVQPSGSWLAEWSPRDWMRMACLIWVAGTVTTLVVSMTRIRRFRLLLEEARPASVDIQEWVDELAARVGLARSPSVWWIDGRVSPMVWSLGWRARLILPRKLWKSLDEHQRATLVIHELAHLCRGDHRVRVFELLVTALYWWHPVLWWARQALRDVEEQCCDAWVVWALPDAAKAYAETLLETLDFLNQSDFSEPLLASGFGKVEHFRKRLTMIMNGTTPRLAGLWGTLGSLGLAAALLPVNPTWAQKPDEQKDVQIIVKTDEDTPATITLVEDNSFQAVASTIDAANPGRLHLEFKGDETIGLVVSDSIDQAIAKVKQEVDEINKEAKQSEEQKAKKKALERVIKELEGVTKKTKELKLSSDKEKVEKERRVIVRRLEEEKKISPEAKAKIDEARAKVKKLRDGLTEKQKELAAAVRDLSKLEAKTRTVTIVARGNAKVEERANARDLPRVKVEPPRVGVMATIPRGGQPPEAAASQKRLDALEKKLEKLLEEVASLKKDRAK
jgi:bla regulator protein blaR1